MRKTPIYDLLIQNKISEEKAYKMALKKLLKNSPGGFIHFISDELWDLEKVCFEIKKREDNKQKRNDKL